MIALKHQDGVAPDGRPACDTPSLGFAAAAAALAAHRNLDDRDR
jgi:hypothetical protein